jgi:simple sugar transport system permease protein
VLVAIGEVPQRYSGGGAAKSKGGGTLNLRTIKRNIPFAATAVVALILYFAAGVRFHGFMSIGVFKNFLSDNSFLGIASIGMTFVILSGGIDLSVGAIVGLSSVLIAMMMEMHHINPVLSVATVLAVGVGLGTGMGLLIQLFALPPFLVTLAGMFFARGLGLVLHPESITINSYDAMLAHWNLPLPLTAVIYLGMFVVALVIAHFTKFGRNVYAIGGNEQSAILMGLPVAKTKVGVYAFSGFCSALAGIVYTLYSPSGYARAADGLELDAIAAVVIGGTLLSGGVGFVAGTFLGVLIFGIIQSAIIFEGTLSSWWTRIAVGMLLLVFILLQKLLQLKKPSMATAAISK